MLTPSSAMGKVKNAVDDTIDSWLATIKGGKIRQEGEETIPEKTENAFDYLRDMFRSDTQGKCLMRHPDFDNFEGYKVELTQVEDHIDMWLTKSGKEEAGTLPLVIKSSTIEGKKLCVIAGENKDGNAAENFYKYYFNNDVDYRDKLKYTNPAKIVIEDKEKITVDGEGCELKDKDLMYFEGNNVCFFPTDNPWGGCKAGDKGLDKDCMPQLENDFIADPVIIPGVKIYTSLKACSG